MKILLLNPPHPAIGSRIPREHLPPLGLLAIGGPLIDAGHQVTLLDAEFGPLSVTQITAAAVAAAPDAVFIGHSGSSTAHPAVCRITRFLKAARPLLKVVYGGVFPTFSWAAILASGPQIDVIVRGEGEATAVQLAAALEENLPLSQVPGIAFREAGRPQATAPAPLLADLDAWRIGWELIEPARYSYWGDRRAVVIQFSRGFPHACSYCGQRGFWRRWRHRNPQRFAAEIAWLHREHGVEVFNFADENPTASRPAWRAFLEALIAENVDVTLVGSTRADDIVRDADILPLYRRAGVARLLLGIEQTDPATLEAVNKGSTAAADRQAIRLLRRNGILSMATYVVGFDRENDRDYFRGLMQLLAYDPDQIQLLYASPHHWTPFAAAQAARRVVQLDRSKWDYKHQVLAGVLPPWRVLFWVKLIEAVMQLRPRALKRWLLHPDPGIRAAIRWYYRIGRKVWLHEIWNWFMRDRRTAAGPTLAEFQAPFRRSGPVLPAVTEPAAQAVCEAP